MLVRSLGCMYGLTFCIVILYENHIMRCTMKAMRRLWGWLCWEDGGLMWLFRKYALFKLSVMSGHRAWGCVCWRGLVIYSLELIANYVLEFW